MAVGSEEAVRASIAMISSEPRFAETLSTNWVADTLSNSTWMTVAGYNTGVEIRFGNRSIYGILQKVLEIQYVRLAKAD